MGGKILLAEDDGNLRETLTEVLRAEGYEVTAVANGQAAMDALDAPDAAHVIILDCLLPKVNGFDVAKFVRGRGLDTPIIFMSGVFKSPEQQKDAKEKYGSKAYLTKPVDGKRLIDTIRPLLVAVGGATNPGAAAQSPLPAEGTLLESPVLYLLWRAAKEAHTGVLEMFGERERARVFAFKGRAVLAQHSDPQLNVGVELVREGVIDADLYKQACELAVQRSMGLFDVLKAEGWATDAQAKAGYKVLIPKVLERVVALSGRFRWVATDGFTSIVPGASVPIIESLLAGVRKATDRELDPHVGPRRPLRLAPGDAWAEVAPKLVEACGSESLTRAINGRATIAQMIEAAPSSAEKASRFRQVYLLMSTMAVRASMEPIPMASMPAAPAQQAPEPSSQPSSPAPQPERPTARAAPQQPMSLDPPMPVREAPLREPAFSTTRAPPQQAHQHQNSSAGVSSGGKAVMSRPVIDESEDDGVMFTPEEDAVRVKIGEKYEEIVGKDFFAILSVKRGSDAATIKRAYFTLAKEFHTDAFAGMNLGTAQKKLDHIFQTIQTANATLTDPTKRGEYEAKLSFEEQGASTDVGAIMQAEADLAKAKLLVERGELGSALKILEKVVVIMPKNDEVLGYQRYCTWWQAKNPANANEACKHLEIHWKAAPGALSLKEFQGWILMEVGDLKGARFAFKKVLELDPKHAGAIRGSRQLQRKTEDEEKKGSSTLSKFLKR